MFNLALGLALYPQVAVCVVKGKGRSSLRLKLEVQLTSAGRTRFARKPLKNCVGPKKIGFLNKPLMSPLFVKLIRRFLSFS